MVIEIDPESLQKAKPLQAAKARKSFPKSRPTSQGGGQQSNQKSSQKGSYPPMVAIPSRHLGMEVSRPSSAQQSPVSSARIPSITVRPVSQVSSQPSIILQSASSSSPPDAVPTSTNTKTALSSSSTSSNNGATLTLNAMHAVGPEAGFGTGGVLLTFNRSAPSATSSSSTGKSDCGPLTAQLSSRTQQISDMV